MCDVAGYDDGSCKVYACAYRIFGKFLAYVGDGLVKVDVDGIANMIKKNID